MKHFVKKIEITEKKEKFIIWQANIEVNVIISNLKHVSIEITMIV